MKLTEQEQNEISNQVLMVGQMCGLSWRINQPLLIKWLASGEISKDFRYENEVKAVINFMRDLKA